MSDFFAFIEGKRTYLVAFVTAVIGLVMAVWPDFTIPEWVYFILSALGLGAVRAAIPPKPPEQK